MSSHPELLPFLAHQLMLESSLFDQQSLPFQSKSFNQELQPEDK
jgi:hypothetical protein